MGTQLAIELPIQNKTYEKALEQYKKLTGDRVLLCYCETKKEYFVNWLFSREFLQHRKVKIIM